MTNRVNPPHAAVTDLRCEYAAAPLGMGERVPRFSWRLDDPRRGACQTAMQIRVTDRPDTLAEGDAAGEPWRWDSGRVATDQSVLVPYAGPPLTSRQRCGWQVRVWDQHGQPTAWSAPAFFEMGLLEAHDWQARWIGIARPGDRSELKPAPYMRKGFTLSGVVHRARLYASAKGVMELRLNDQRVGEDLLTPGWTEYATRFQYRAYDVTAMLRTGENVLGAIVGDGWYSGWTAQGPRVYGEDPMLAAQLEIELEDGRRLIVATDGSWKATTGPIVHSDLFQGEFYDARLELPGWDGPGYDDAAWRTVDLVEDLDPAKMTAAPGPAVRAIMRLKPITVRQASEGAWLFDMGQNMVGHVRVTVAGERGSTLTIRHGEMLNPDGSLHVANLRRARATDTYVLRGEVARDRNEVWEPRFTFHGFRYVEITGWPYGSRPSADAVQGVVVHSDMAVTGEFACSNKLVNQLQHNIQWGQRGNFVDIPTDCPQRDERLGWTGDAQVFIGTACFNMDVQGFFAKWLTDLTDAQLEDGWFPNFAPRAVASGGNAPAWDDAGVICPWTVYQAYADRRILERCYESMKRYLDCLERHSDNLVRPFVPYYGDWLSIDATTPHDLIATAYFAHSVRIVADAAAALGRDEEAGRYQDLFARIRQAFQRAFVTAGGRVSGESQTAYVLALHFDLLPEDKRGFAADRLEQDIDSLEHKGHLSTGFVGVRDLNPALTAAGRLARAYRLLKNTTYPSWLYAVVHGATTIWERWDGWTAHGGIHDPGMNSFNHYAYGAIGQWLYESVAGLRTDPARPGYKHVLIAPRPDPTNDDPITWARAVYRGVHGRIETHWRVADGSFDLDVTIPANATATVWLPHDDPSACTEMGRPLDKTEGVSAVRAEGASVACEIAAGRYAFGCPWSRPRT